MESAMYSSCIFHDMGSCGRHARSKKDGMFQVSSLDKCVTSHVKSIGVTDTSELSEAELISSRAERELLPSDMVCAYHRFTFGTYWRASKLCKHPEHIYAGKMNKKFHGMRPARDFIRRQIQHRYQVTIPIGTLLCVNHRKLEEERACNRINDHDDNEQPDVVETPVDDDDFVPPPEIHVDDTSKEELDSFTESAELESSPMKCSAVFGEQRRGYLVPVDQQNWISSMEKKHPVAPPIKQEQEEPWASYKGQQLQDLDEADVSALPFTVITVKSEDDEEQPQFSQFSQSNHLDPDGHLQQGTDDKTSDTSEPETDDSDDWTDTKKSQSSFSTQKTVISKSKMRSNSAEKEFSSTAYPKTFKQKNDEGQLKNVDEADITHFPITVVSVKNENEHISNTDEDMKTHSDGEDCGGSGDVNSFDPDCPFQPDTYGSSESSEPDTDNSDDWMETRASLSNLNSQKTDDSAVKCNAADKPFSCSLCSKTFRHKSKLNRHMRNHTGKKPFSCTECPKRFSGKGILKAHMKIHTGEKPFSCSECGQKFRKSSHLKTHMRVHTGEKPFGCPDCNQRFSQKGSLQTHMRIHTGERPFSCMECDKSFSDKGNLTVHMRIHTGEKPFKCADCGQRFRKSSHLKTHVRIHTGEKPFSCSECSQSFSKKMTLVAHTRIHTAEKLALAACSRIHT